VALVIAVVASLLGQASTSWASKPHQRSGFFIGFGLGIGSAGWDWTNKNFGDEQEGSGVGNFRIGGSIRENLVLGLESSSWVKHYKVEGSTIEARQSFSTATFAATLFPGNMGLFIRGGVGFSTADVEIDLGSGFAGSKSESGVAVLVAGGYEFRLTDKFALGPQTEFIYLGINGDLVDTAYIVSGSLQLNWYW
jgi:hypothetical protein